MSEREIRPRRSALYVPGSNARALAKARTVPADMLIFDWEDAVAPEAKPAARDAVATCLAEGGFGPRELLVRVNGPDTPWGQEDMRLAATLPVDGIVLPKVENARVAGQAAAILDHCDSRAEIWCMMETPRGMLAVAEIAGAHPKLAGLIMGTSDLVRDLHARHTRDRLPLLTGLGLCLLAARAHGLAILDGVHLDLDDDDGFAHACRQGREFGFDGKTLIHPKTVALANTIFGPDEVAVAEAQRIVEAFAAASERGQGVAMLDGRLIENLHAAEARRVLALARRINALNL